MATCSLQNTTSTSPHLCGEHSQTKAEQYQCGDITLLLGGAARMRLKPKGTDYREKRTSLIAWVQYHANAMQLQRSTAYAAVFLLDRLAAATDVANSVCRTKHTYTHTHTHTQTHTQINTRSHHLQ